MSRGIKIGLWLISGVIGLLVIGVVALVFLIDPNKYKPAIEKAVAQSGYQLQLKGDLGWQLFPRLAITMNTVSFGVPEKPTLLEVDTMSASVAIGSLLGKRAQINSVYLNEPRLQLVTEANGENNFSVDGATKTQPETAAEKSTASHEADIGFESNNIQINNAQLIYRDEQTGDNWTVEKVNLETRQMNNAGNPFPITFSAAIAGNALPAPVAISLKSNISFNQAKEQAAVSALDITIDSDKANTRAIAENIQLTLGDDVNASGAITIEQTNLRDWLGILSETPLVTKNENALTRFSFNSDFTFKNNTLTLPAIALSLDDTTINGSVAVQLPKDETTNLAITTNLNVTSVNIDDYLAPAEEKTNDTETSVAAVETALPLDSLRDINANIAFTANSVIASELSFTNINMAISGNNGLWQLKKLAADFYEGAIVMDATVDARNSAATIAYNGKISNVALNPLLTDFAEFSDLTGAINATIQANTRAATDLQIMKNLAATANITSDELRVNGLNVERYYCSLASEVDKETEGAEKTWPDYTDVTGVNATVSINNEIIALQQFTAKAVNLDIAPKGQLNLANNEYNVAFIVKLLDKATGAKGCVVNSQFLLNRPISVATCKGSLNTMDFAKQCGLDRSAIGDLAKQALRYNADKAIDPKKKEIRENLKDKLRDAIGGDKPAEDNAAPEEEKSTKDLLRDFLKR